MTCLVKMVISLYLINMKPLSYPIEIRFLPSAFSGFCFVFFGLC